MSRTGQAALHLLTPRASHADGTSSSQTAQAACRACGMRRAKGTALAGRGLEDEPHLKLFEQRLPVYQLSHTLNLQSWRLLRKPIRQAQVHHSLPPHRCTNVTCCSAVSCAATHARAGCAGRRRVPRSWRRAGKGRRLTGADRRRRREATAQSTAASSAAPALAPPQACLAPLPACTKWRRRCVWQTRAGRGKGSQTERSLEERQGGRQGACVHERAPGQQE